MSGEGYYDLAETGDDELTELWDSFARLPEPGENDILDAFVRSKNITIPALVKLGTRLAQDHVLVYAFNGGLKYRDMQSGQRWNSAGAEFPTLKIVRAGIKPADTVIVAEGETDTARLTLMYPDVDVACLPAGAKRFTQGFADQLARYSRVILGLDNDPAGEDGREIIRGYLPAALTLLPESDWSAWPQGATPPDLPEPDATMIGALPVRDLLPAFRGELPPPKLLVDDLPIYDEGVHLVSAHPGAGKSLFCMTVAVLAMIDGHHVVWLDYEQGERMTGQRMREIGASEQMIREQFHYVWDPPIKAADNLSAIHERYPHALIVFDSASKALRRDGLDENSAPEVTGWTMKLIAAAKTQRMPIIVIDHVAKNAKDSRYSRGSGSKLADVDVHVSIEVLIEFDRETIGEIAVHRHKDREAWLPRIQWFQVGDAKGNLPFVPIDGPTDVEALEQGLPSL